MIGKNFQRNATHTTPVRSILNTLTQQKLSELSLPLHRQSKR